jgi:hypothetical protein
MKRVAIFLMGILAALVVLGPGPVAAGDDGGMVAGAGAGVFPGGALFAGLSLSGLEFGQGVLTAPDGAVSGAFYAVLQGTSALGRSQLVSVDGNVNAGGVAGIATFSGTATVNLGDGAVPVPGVPFQVSVTPEGLQLTLDGTLLPTVALSSGAIAIE